MKAIKAKEIDKKFDEGEDITVYLDLVSAKRPYQKRKRVSIAFPLWMINLLDKEARRLGIPRQYVIEVWLAEHLEEHGMYVPGR